MNLKQTIRRILIEEYSEKQKKLLNYMSNSGFLATAKLVGGVKKLLSILGDEFLMDDTNKINIIKEIVELTDEEYIALININENPIVVNDEDGEISQIEMLYANDVAIFHYGGHEYSEDLGETYKDYDRLPKEIIEDIFNMVVNFYLDEEDNMLQESIRRILREETELPLLIRRRVDIDELNGLVDDVKSLIDSGYDKTDAIYDTIRQFVASKRTFRFNDETEQQYWDSYLEVEKPLVDYVKSKLKER